MELKDGMTVKSPCKGYKIKKGELFVISNVTVERDPFKYSFEAEIKNGGKIFCLLHGCSHLQGKNWIIVNTTNP